MRYWHGPGHVFGFAQEKTGRPHPGFYLGPHPGVMGPRRVYMFGGLCCIAAGALALTMPAPYDAVMPVWCVGIAAAGAARRPPRRRRGQTVS